MSPLSYSDVFALDLDREYDEEIYPGAVARTGQNHFPHFQVVAVHSDKAWVPDLQSGQDHIARTRRLRLMQRSTNQT